MKVIDPGHKYQLKILDGHYMSGDEDVILTFVKREGPGFPGNVGHHAGTTIQEVLRALIDRVKYLNNQIQDDRNRGVIADLRHAIYLLELRAAERHGRELALSWWAIEDCETCPKCLHIGCKGNCHL